MFFDLLFVVASFVLRSFNLIDCCVPHVLVIFCCMPVANSDGRRKDKVIGDGGRKRDFVIFFELIPKGKGPGDVSEE